MPRPKKCRRVCRLPDQNRFGPLGMKNPGECLIFMTVEEYEAIRLIDLEGMTQEQCAEKMNVARTTVQSIYANARQKLAQSLVNGNVLHIEGGDYKLCDENTVRCGGRGCRRHRHNPNGGTE